MLMRKLLLTLKFNVALKFNVSLISNNWTNELKPYNFIEPSHPQWTGCKTTDKLHSFSIIFIVLEIL